MSRAAEAEPTGCRAESDLYRGIIIQCGGARVIIQCGSLYRPVWAARWIIFNVHWTGCTGCISVGPLLEQEVAVVVAPLLLLVVVVVAVVVVAPLSLV